MLYVAVSGAKQWQKLTTKFINRLPIEANPGPSLFGFHDMKILKAMFFTLFVIVYATGHQRGQLRQLIYTYRNKAAI